MMTLPLDTWVRILSFAPIVACSVVGFAMTLWKWRQLGAAAPRPIDLARVRASIGAGDVPGAIALTAAEVDATARLIHAVLARAGRARATLVERARQAGAELARELEYGLGALALIATLGPLFGLLGTVIGITLVFERMASTGGFATPQDLAGGIGTALHTTIAGLLVGILALVFHRYFAARVDHLLGRLETVGAELIDQLGGEPE